MKLTFLGAARTVTGSCYWLSANGKNILIECGMFQGQAKENELNFEEFPFDPSTIDYIFLTHAHIDHSGRIPKIYKEGFRGRVICTKATKDLCEVMLPDSGFIQEIEAEWKNRKLKREGARKVEPLYTHNEANDCLASFDAINYYEEIDIDENIRVKFSDAGHLLGSSIIEMWVKEGDKETKLVFTGDLGNVNLPLLRGYDTIENMDYLVVESTYGGRLHKENNEERIIKFLDAIRPCLERGGNVVIPSFAVGRTQELIYDLNKYRDAHPDEVKFLDHIPVYVDSPLAINATEIFKNNMDCFNDEVRDYIEHGKHPLDFEELIFTKTPEESMALNEKPGAKIIISASGMCEAGRIKHHLKHNLWKEDSVIVFVGYQAEGTLGRQLVDGAEKVKIYGEYIGVKAKVVSIQGYSGHADQDGLMKWMGAIKHKPSKVFIVHGEPEAQDEFERLIHCEFQYDTVKPEQGDSYELDATNVVSSSSYKEIKNRFLRLQLLSQIDVLQEQAEILSSKIDQISLNDKSDEEVIDLYEKLINVEKDLRKIKFLLVK
ncbi:MAG: MBL fold metallo-hydrolase [Clostridia bacterium]|nr:MBL fold metallo-hydrolase [Clostridia bacterium]